MKKLVFLVFCIILLSACSDEQTSSTELCGYGPMMVINGKEYLRFPVKDTYTLGQQLGKIKEKIDEDFHPVENFSSNTLEVGSTIYKVKDQDNYLIAKTQENKYLLFEEID